MKQTYHASFVSLHVRKTNRAALALYKDTLGFEVVDIEKGYYADGEVSFCKTPSLFPFSRFFQTALAEPDLISLRTRN